MNKTLITILLPLVIGALLKTYKANAQDPNAKPHGSAPIPVEIFFGNERLVTEFVMSKKFNDISRFGLLAKSYFAVDYSNDKSKNESVNGLLINYELLNGLGIAAGGILNSQWGFRPYSAGQYTYVTHNFAAMVLSGFFLTESHNFETSGFIEYRPKLKNNWSVYSYVEGLYNLDMGTDKHDRSYIWGRLGLHYKTFGFGLAANYDWYGPFKENKINAGVFLRTVFR